jgi:ABC-2 type transport system permease protein
MSFMMSFYQAQFKNSLAIQLQYRVAMGIWMIGLVLEPVIYLSVWTSIAQSNGGSVGGFTTGDFAAYYIVLLILQHFTQSWDMWQFEYLIKMGGMSERLLRPVHPIHRDAASNLSYKVLMLVVVVPALIILVIVFRPTFNTELWAVLAFIPAVVLGGILAFLMGWVIALSAFWTTRTFAVNQTYFISMFFFSGQIAPLELLPSGIQSIAYIMPFRWFVSFPTELFLGRLTPEQALGGFVAQILWITVAYFLMQLVWKAGVRQYTAMGG